MRHFFERSFGGIGHWPTALAVAFAFLSAFTSFEAKAEYSWCYTTLKDYPKALIVVDVAWVSTPDKQAYIDGFDQLVADRYASGDKTRTLTSCRQDADRSFLLKDYYDRIASAQSSGHSVFREIFEFDPDARLRPDVSTPLDDLASIKRQMASECDTGSNGDCEALAARGRRLEVEAEAQRAETAAIGRAAASREALARQNAVRVKGSRSASSSNGATAITTAASSAGGAAGWAYCYAGGDSGKPVIFTRIFALHDVQVINGILGEEDNIRLNNAFKASLDSQFSGTGNCRFGANKDVQTNFDREKESYAKLGLTIINSDWRWDGGNPSYRGGLAQ